MDNNSWLYEDDTPDLETQSHILYEDDMDTDPAEETAPARSSLVPDSDDDTDEPDSYFDTHRPFPDRDDDVDISKTRLVIIWLTRRRTRHNLA